MSLLLDALKKAADDKKKNLDEPAVPEKNPEQDESLELELDFETDTTPAEIEEEFPEVDESSIRKDAITEPSIESEPETQGKEESEAETTNKDLDTSKTTNSLDQAVFEHIESSAANVEPEAPEEESSQEAIPGESLNAEPTKVAIDEPKIEDTQSAKPTPPVSPVDESISRKIETEQALSALINKSNQHSRHEYLKRTITIAVLALLLLIGSGLYFYVQMDTASQELFISNNNNAPVIRSTEDIQTTNNTAATNTPVVEIVDTITPKTTTPAPAKPAQNTTAKKTAPLKRVTAPKKINIIHTKKADPVNTLLQEAYLEFQRGNYEQAKKLYNQVNLREPKNRDALLGLSAVAIKQQRFEYARQKYQYLLKLNPKDSIAIAGMSSIKNNIDPQLNESQLKFMLKEKPDSAHLYFALGSLYSLQSKWPEAQSAYFSAWSAENKNADYAYNLAVSLDHLNKKNQALDFYKLSLKLMSETGSNFSQQAANKRVSSLQGISQ